MKRFPIYLQYDAMDCGATCVRMILSYFGKRLSASQVDRLCPKGKTGVSLLSIDDTFKGLGFETIAGRVAVDDILSKASLPCILHWRGEHFVVLYKVSHRGKNFRIHIADPAQGNIVIDRDEFVENWTGGAGKGIALFANPTDKFDSIEVADDGNGRSLGFLFSYFRKFRSKYISLIIGLLIGGAIQIVFPFVTQMVMDEGIVNGDINLIYMLLLGQLVLYFGQFGIEAYRNWVLLKISTRINISLVSDFLKKLIRLPMRFFDSTLLGDFVQRIRDHERLETFITSNTLNTIFSMLVFVVFGIVLAVYNLYIFGVFLIGTLLYLGWIFLFMNRRRQVDYKLFAQEAKVQNSTYQFIYGMQEIKLQNCGQKLLDNWSDLQFKYLDMQTEALSISQKQEIGSRVINEVKNLLITFMSALLVVDGKITLGMMLAIQYIVGQLNSPVSEFLTLVRNYQDAVLGLERINQIHQRDDENSSCGKIEDVVNGDIVIDNLSFRYGSENYPLVLDNVNLTIPKGKVTAIVGASGSGKTTLLKLILGYYKPTEGDIIVGDHNLNDFDITCWRQKCGVVMQDGFVFSDTIAGNIAVSSVAPDAERLSYASRISNIEGFVESFPRKYDTKIGADGQNLSQGQRQRLLIARAVYKNPDFLFFDEATNALDTENEKVITDNLNHFYKDKTTVIVAHRLSTVRNADQIVVLDKGRVVEIGNHAQLTQKKGYYYNLVHNQLDMGE